MNSKNKVALISAIMSILCCNLTIAAPGDEYNTKNIKKEVIYPAKVRTDFVRGVDISTLPEIEA